MGFTLSVSLLVLACSAVCPLDCQLNGVCHKSRCTCDKGWTGDHCSMLNVGVSTVVWPSSAQNTSTSTRAGAWGGSILKDEQGIYHLYDDVVCEGVGCWHSHAQIIHATASAAEGPYQFQSVVIPPEVENIHATRSPDGDHVLLWYVNHTNVNSEPNTCTGSAAGWQPTEGHDWMQPSREFIQSDTSPNSSSCESHREGNWTVAEGLGIAVAASPEGPFEFA